MTTDTNTAQALADECAQLASQYAEAYRHTGGTKSYDQWAAFMQAIRRLAALASQAAEQVPFTREQRTAAIMSAARHTVRQQLSGAPCASRPASSTK